MSACSSPLFTPPSSPRLEKVGAASRKAPDVAGLYYLSSFFDSIQCQEIIQDVIKESYFDIASGRDQVVLFGNRDVAFSSGLPKWCDRFLTLASDLLQEDQLIPLEVINLLFPPLGASAESTDATLIRQMILNCYEPGQGITAHIDLPHKFADGIMIFSFGSGITMEFQSSRQDEEATKHAIYLTPGSLCILTGGSRWEWKHGISSRFEDWVVSEDGSTTDCITRDKRLSITVRWYNVNSQETINSHRIEKDMINARRTDKNEI